MFGHRQGIKLIGLSLTAALVLSACGRPPSPSASAGDVYNPEEDPLVNPASLFVPPPEDRSQIAADETIKLHLSGSPNTLNPLFASSLYESIVIGTLYTGLFTFDKEMEWHVNDEVVESFEESEDHTTYTVKIRPGIKWQDGEPFTAHDVVFSWKQILDPQVPAITLKSGTEPVEECVAIDDLTVRFVIPEALATSRWSLMFPIVPEHIFAKQKEEHPDLKTGEYYNRQARHPVGSGPYRIVEWDPNSRIVVERWEDFHGKKPYFKRIIFEIIPDANVSLLSFEKGSVDVLRQLTAQQFARETNTDSFADVGYKALGTQWSFSYIGWNMDGSNPFFDDVRVRTAMTHAMNIPLIIEKVLYNLPQPSSGIYHPDSWMYSSEVERLEYDLEKAAALLDEAGWKVNPDDGWRYKQIDGRMVPFQFTLLIPQGSDTSPKIAAIFRQDLQQIGVRMDTTTMEWSVFLEKVRNHEFEASIAGWGTGTDPSTGANLWKTEQYEEGRNYGGYSNPRVDKLFDMGENEFDFEKRREIYQEIHKILYEDQPYTWLFYQPVLAAFNKRVQGVQFSPRGIYGFDPGMSAWWVPSGQAKYATMP